MDKLRWFEKIDWQPFLWFSCFLILIGIALFVRQKADLKIAADLLMLAAGAIAPRIRSTAPRYYEGDKPPA